MSSDACASQGKTTGVDSRGDLPLDRMSGKRDLRGGHSSAKQARAPVRLPREPDPASSLGKSGRYPPANLNGVGDCMGSPITGKEVAASLTSQSKNLAPGQSPLFSASQLHTQNNIEGTPQKQSLPYGAGTADRS
jgi:hypothetical protein